MYQIINPNTGISITTGASTTPGTPSTLTPGVLTSEEKQFIRAAAAEIKAEAEQKRTCAHGFPVEAIALASGKDAEFVTEATALRKSLIALMAAELTDSVDSPRIGSWGLRSLIDCISRLEDYISSAEMEVMWGEGSIAKAARSTDPTFNFTCPACGESVTVRPVHKLQQVSKSPDNTQKPDGDAEPQAVTPVPVTPEDLTQAKHIVMPDELTSVATTPDVPATATEESAEMSELDLDKTIAAVTKAAVDAASATAAATVSQVLASLAQAGVMSLPGVPSGIQPNPGMKLTHPGTGPITDNEAGEMVKVAPDGGLVTTVDTIPTISSDAKEEVAAADTETEEVVEAGKKGVNPFAKPDDDDDDDVDKTKKKKKVTKAEDEESEATATDETVPVVEASTPEEDLAALATLRSQAGQGIRDSYDLTTEEGRSSYIASVVAAQATRTGEINMSNIGQMPRSDLVRAARTATPGSKEAAAASELSPTEATMPGTAQILSQLFTKQR